MALDQPTRVQPGHGDSRLLKAVLAAALLLWLWVSLPVALGERTFFFRDVFSNHLPVKAFGSQALREGSIPAFNPQWGLGQPFRGNPSALAFYPDNVLYLVLPFWSAFNVHFALHWLVCLASMWVLARQLGLGPAGALCAGLSYAGSGWVLSTLSFYNLVTLAAWWPLVLAGAARGGRRGMALSGLACGLALLGGEPLSAAIGVVPWLLVATSAHGWRRGLRQCLASGVLGLLLASPQLVATARILAFSFRGGPGVAASQASYYSLHPLRLLELVVPLPFGWPGHLGRYGFWANAIAEGSPYFFTIYFGVVGLALAVAAAHRRRRWALLAAAGLLLAWLGGLSGELMIELGHGLFRFPEKFLLWPAVAAPLLAGWGLEAVLRDRGGWSRWVTVAAGALLALAAVLAAVEPLIARQASPSLSVKGLALLETQVWLWVQSLALAGALLLAAAVSARRGLAAAVVAVQLAALTQMYPLLRTEDTAPYRQPPPWLERVGSGSAVVNSNLSYPPWHPSPDYRFPAGPRSPKDRVVALDLGPTPGVLYDLSYPLLPDLEGMHSPLNNLLLYNLPRLGWRERLNWFRALGIDAAVLFEVPGQPGLELADMTERFGVTTRLYKVRSPAPLLWWPESVTLAANPIEALKAVSTSTDPLHTVVLPQPLDHVPGGRLELLSCTADRIEFQAQGGGGVVVVGRAYHPLLRARASGQSLRTLPANLCLLGVVVPAGEHRVVVSVDSWPECLAGVVALISLLATAVALSPWQPGSLALQLRRRRAS